MCVLTRANRGSHAWSRLGSTAEGGNNGFGTRAIIARRSLLVWVRYNDEDVWGKS